MKLFSLFLLCGLAGVCNSAPADLRAPFLEIARPMVVVFGAGKELKESQLLYSKLLQDQNLGDFDLGLRVIAEDEQPGSGLGPWVRSRFGIGKSSWVLIGRGGQVLASGVQIPESSSLADSLTAAGEQSPIRNLKAFLRIHPDQLESRIDLIQRLARQASRRQGVVSRDLDPETDRAIWGPLSVEIETIFMGPDWSALDFYLDRCLPAVVPERFSPLMRALYQKIRPQVLDLLTVLPDHPLAWALLLRIDEALGTRDVIELLGGTAFFHTPFNHYSLPYALPKRVIAEARRSGSYAKALPILKKIWTESAAYDLDKMGIFSNDVEIYKAPNRLMTPEERTVAQSNRLSLVWSANVAPLLEAMIQCRADAEARELLCGLDVRWAAVDWVSWAIQLANATERPDLAKEWKSLRNFRQSAIPPQVVSDSSFTLFRQGQDGALDNAAFSLRAQGINIDVEIPPASWKAYLGWTDQRPHWCLVDPQGSILLKGGLISKPEELFEQFQFAGIKGPGEEALDFIKKNPYNLSAKIALAESSCNRIQAALITKLQSSQNRKGKEKINDDSASIIENTVDQYVNSIKDIFASPYGIVSDRFSRWPYVWPTFAGPQAQKAREYDSLVNIANLYLPRIEDDLVRRPTDQALWATWISLGLIVDRPIKPIIQRLIPPPQTNEFPPKWVGRNYIVALLMNQKWPALESYLRPEWTAFCGRVMEANPSLGDQTSLKINEAWFAILEPLAEAYLRLGRPNDADELIRTWVNWRFKLGNMGRLCITAKSLKYNELSAEWADLKVR